MHFHTNIDSDGFTIFELIIILAILGTLCSMAIPAFSSWIPEYKLKNAARELYSSMHLAKMMSIKQSDDYMIIFDTGGDGSYQIVRPDGTTERNISFMKYDKSGGIGYGLGKATKGATISGSSGPADGVSYFQNRISFNPRGLGSGMGYTYLENKKGTAYAVGTWITGIIVLKKWNEAKGEWE